MSALLDAELATLYGVATKVLLQAVRRNSARFPEDFMIQLTTAEWAALRSQIVTLELGRGQHRKYLPYAFTEQGVAMLSSALNRQRALFSTTEYGSVKDPQQFKALYAYSPNHHVKAGTAYPAIFMAAGATGGRVNPAHSRK